MIKPGARSANIQNYQKSNFSDTSSLSFGQWFRKWIDLEMYHFKGVSILRTIYPAPNQFSQPQHLYGKGRVTLIWKLISLNPLYCERCDQYCVLLCFQKFILVFDEQCHIHATLTLGIFIDVLYSIVHHIPLYACVIRTIRFMTIVNSQAKWQLCCTT